MKNDNKGFSLIELIVVIAIMAILVGSLAPQFMKYIESSRQSTDIQNASAIRSAIEAYVAETSTSTDIVVSSTAAAAASPGNAATKARITVTGDAGLATALTDVGLDSTVICNSDGWPSNASVAKYNVTTYKWETSETKNTKKPEKDLQVAFQ